MQRHDYYYGKNEIMQSRWTKVMAMAQNSYCIGKHRSVLLLCPPFFVFHISRWCCFTTVGIRFFVFSSLPLRQIASLTLLHTHINILYAFYGVFFYEVKLLDFQTFIVQFFAFAYIICQWLRVMWVKEWERGRERNMLSCKSVPLPVQANHVSVYVCLVFGRESYLIFS